MATHVTQKQYSDVFKLMHQMTSGKLLARAHEELLELQVITDTVFKETKDRSRLYTGIKTAIEILSKEKYPEANYKILLAVARKTSNSAIKICALQNAVTAFLKYDDWDEALVAAKEIPDDDERDQAFHTIIKRMIETEDLQQALDIIEINITDSAMEEDLCAEIVAKFREKDGEGDEEVALRAADKACSAEISAQLARFFAEREKKMDLAMEALGQIQDSALMEKTLLECTQYIASEEDLDSVIHFINESEQGILLNRIEKLARALIDHKKTDLAMKIVDSLAKGGEDEERVSESLANICQHFIEKKQTANVLKIAAKIIDLIEFDTAKRKTLLLGIIQSLKDHHKPAVANQVQKLLARL